MNNSMKASPYLAIFFIVLVLLAPLMSHGAAAKEKAILDASLQALGNGHDLSRINAWHASARTQHDGETSNTNFNSSCGSLVYGYRESEKSIVQSNVNFTPEFPPHIAGLVLFGEAHDPDSVIAGKGSVSENGKVYDVVSIRPSYRGNRDAGYAPEQLWYFDQSTKLPQRVKFTGKDGEAILFLEDFQASGEGWLAPFSAKYSAGPHGQSAYQYTQIVLRHEQCP